MAGIRFLKNYLQKLINLQQLLFAFQCFMMGFEKADPVLNT